MDRGLARHQTCVRLHQWLCSRSRARPASSPLLRAQQAQRRAQHRPAGNTQQNHLSAGNAQSGNPDYELPTSEMSKLPRNPLDPITFHRLEAQRRAYYMRRLYISGLGLLLVVGMTIGTISMVDIEKMTEKTDALSDDDPLHKVTPGTPIVVGATGGTEVKKAGEGAGLASEDQDGEQVPTGTSSVPTFPRTMLLPDESRDANAPVTRTEYQLTGLGIRTVSFLGIQVYVVGLYVAADDVPTLQTALIKQAVGPDVGATALILSEKKKLRDLLLDPVESERVWSEVLRENRIRTVFRIVPTRTTDFQHLRDGWLRAITSRTQKADLDRQRGGTGLDAFDDDGFGKAVQDFKAVFGGGRKGPKGAPMLLVRDQDGRLHVRYTDTSGSGSPLPSSSSPPLALAGTTPPPSSSSSSSSQPISTVLSTTAAAVTSTSSTTSSNQAAQQTLQSQQTKQAQKPQQEAQEIGLVTDERISRLIWLNYLAGNKVASESARKSIVDGVMELVQKPVGAVTSTPVGGVTPAGA